MATYSQLSLAISTFLASDSQIIINYFTYIRNVCFIKHSDELLFRLAHINSRILVTIKLCKNAIFEQRLHYANMPVNYAEIL